MVCCFKIYPIVSIGYKKLHLEPGVNHWPMSHLLRTIAPPLYFCTSAPHQHLSTSYLCTSAEPPCTSAPPLLNRHLVLHPSTSPAPVQTPAQTPAPAPVFLILCTYSGSTSVPQHLFTSSCALFHLCRTSAEPLQSAEPLHLHQHRLICISTSASLQKLSPPAKPVPLC